MYHLAAHAYILRCGSIKLGDQEFKEASDWQKLLNYEAAGRGLCSHVLVLGSSACGQAQHIATLLSHNEATIDLSQSVRSEADIEEQQEELDESVIEDCRKRQVYCFCLGICLSQTC